MCKVSIIVPVFKAEKYIHQCVDSILFQTYTDWECILVDDGSPDSSGVICDEYVAKDSRILVIHKENGGVSSARNAALKILNGKWLTFVDADDCLYPTALERWIKIAEQNDLDLVQCHFNREYITGQVVADTTPVQTTIQYAASKDYLVCVGGSLFKTEIVQANSLRFNESISLGEDQLFFYSYIQYCSRIQRLGDVLYYYRVNNNSATHHQQTFEILKTLQHLVQIKSNSIAWSAPIDSTLLHFIIDLIINQDLKDTKLLSIIKECNISNYSMMSNSLKCICVLIKIMPSVAIFCIKRIYGNK